MEFQLMIPTEDEPPHATNITLILFMQNTPMHQKWAALRIEYAPFKKKKKKKRIPANFSGGNPDV
jgi:hypothetical protein